MKLLAPDPWLAAARSVILHGTVGPDHPGHLAQHPQCEFIGQRDTVYTRCCRQPIPLGRSMWPCEIPLDTGIQSDCCDRPFAVFGEPE